MEKFPIPSLKGQRWIIYILFNFSPKSVIVQRLNKREQYSYLNSSTDKHGGTAKGYD